MALRDRLKEWSAQLLRPGARNVAQMRVDKALVGASAGFRDDRKRGREHPEPGWWAATAYERSNTGPGGAPHLAWQRIAPIYEELLERWRAPPVMLAYVLGFAVGAADAGNLTPTDLEELLGRLSRRGAIVINESRSAEGLED